MSKLSIIEWDLFRSSALVLVLTTFAGAGMVYLSGLYLDRAEQVYVKQRAKLDGVARLYRTAENDRSLYSRYVQRYEELESQGVIGAEPRLNWVEALESINQELKLPVLRYEIDPQQLLKFEPGRFDDRIMSVYRSSMKFDAGLLHEGDLITLINQLRALTSGRFEVRSCSLKTNSAQRRLVFDGRTPNLSTVCQIDWYTVKVESAAARDGS